MKPLFSLEYNTFHIFLANSFLFLVSFYDLFFNDLKSSEVYREELGKNCWENSDQTKQSIQLSNVYTLINWFSN